MSYSPAVVEHTPLLDLADGKSSLPNDMDNSDAEDRKAQAMAMRAALKSLAASSTTGDEGSPLTTKALRDLERIKREIVYTETLVKIR